MNFLTSLITKIVSEIILPLLQKWGLQLSNLVKDAIERRRLKKEIKLKTKALKNANTGEDIRKAHRNNTRL